MPAAAAFWLAVDAVAMVAMWLMFSEAMNVKKMDRGDKAVAVILFIAAILLTVRVVGRFDPVYGPAEVAPPPPSTSVSLCVPLCSIPSLCLCGELSLPTEAAA